MDKLNLKYNACKIDARVAGQDSHGSGFLYVTSPGSKYNYVVTAKHILSEDSTVNPQLSDITELSIMVAAEEGFVTLERCILKVWMKIYFSILVGMLP